MIGKVQLLLPVWKRGVLGHVYWLGEKRLGGVNVPPRRTGGVKAHGYGWCLELPRAKRVHGRSSTLEEAKDCVERAYRDHLAAFPHTSEPWTVVESGHSHPTQYLCVQIGSDPSYTTLELKPADARRIVACVNACCNVSTEELEVCEPDALSEVFDEWRHDRTMRMTGMDNM